MDSIILETDPTPLTKHVQKLWVAVNGGWTMILALQKFLNLPYLKFTRLEFRKQYAGVKKMRKSSVNR